LNKGRLLTLNKFDKGKQLVFPERYRKKCKKIRVTFSFISLYRKKLRNIFSFILLLFEQIMRPYFAETIERGA